MVVKGSCRCKTHGVLNSTDPFYLDSIEKLKFSCTVPYVSLLLILIGSIHFRLDTPLVASYFACALH